MTKQALAVQFAGLQFLRKFKVSNCNDSTNLQRKWLHVHVISPSVAYEGDSLLASKNSSLIHSL